MTGTAGAADRGAKFMCLLTSIECVRYKTASKCKLNVRDLQIVELSVFFRFVPNRLSVADQCTRYLLFILAPWNAIIRFDSVHTWSLLKYSVIVNIADLPPRKHGNSEFIGVPQ